MTLSDAIRKGATMHPQGFGSLVVHVGDEDRTCALGAAYAGLYGEVPSERWPDWARDFPVLTREVAFPCVCPVLCDLYGQVGQVRVGLTHLNDAHRWTRERIADWVQGVEEGA